MIEDRNIMWAFDAEAYRNEKRLDEEKKEELLLKWKQLCEELPEDEAFRQVTKFLRS